MNNEGIKNMWVVGISGKAVVQLDIGTHAVKLAGSGQITRHIETERSVIQEWDAEEFAEIVRDGSSIGVSVHCGTKGTRSEKRWPRN